MRRYLLIGATVALLAVPALAFGRAATTVKVQNNFFQPANTAKTDLIAPAPTPLGDLGPP